MCFRKSRSFGTFPSTRRHALFLGGHHYSTTSISIRRQFSLKSPSFLIQTVQTKRFWTSSSCRCFGTSGTPPSDNNDDDNQQKETTIDDTEKQARAHPHLVTTAQVASQSHYSKQNTIHACLILLYHYTTLRLGSVRLRRGWLFRFSRRFSGQTLPNEYSIGNIFRSSRRQDSHQCLVHILMVCGHSSNAIDCPLVWTRCCSHGCHVFAREE